MNLCRQPGSGKTFQSKDELLQSSLAPFDGLGTHLLADFYRCSALPDKAAQLESLMLQVAELIEATVVETSFHEFSPIGLSGVVVIAESHLSIHTWPEHNAACFDLFTCSNKMKTQPALVHLWEQLAASELHLDTIVRGRHSGIPSAKLGT